MKNINKLKKGDKMIVINDEAYIIADSLCFELFTKREVKKAVRTGSRMKGSTGGTYKKTGVVETEFIGKRYYSNLDNALNGYICEQLLKIGRKEEAIPIKEVIEEIKQLKRELVLQFNLVTDKTAKR